MCVCVWLCVRICVCGCFVIPRHCGSAHSLILAAHLCVYVRVCAYVCVCACVCLCMRVSPLHFVSIAYVGNKRFREVEKNELRMDRRTDGRMDGPTDRRKDGRTDKASYRDVWTHLKIPWALLVGKRRGSSAKMTLNWRWQGCHCRWSWRWSWHILWHIWF